MQLHVVDAKDVTGHHKFQTQSPKADVLQDQDQAATVCKDMVMVDTLALSAHTDKLETQIKMTNVWTQLLAQEQIKSNLLSILLLVVDVKLANIQHSSQIFQELTVSKDHLPSVPIAPPDNQMMDTLVRIAQ